MSATPSLQDVLSFSRYLTRLAAAQPALLAEVDAIRHSPLDSARLDSWVAQQQIDEGSLKSVLRRMKQWGLMQIACRDLAGQAALTEVTEGMTLLAERAVSLALECTTQALAARHGQPRNAAGEVQQLIVVGMGKLGGRELNVSSDIDLIFVYPDDGDTDGETADIQF